MPCRRLFHEIFGLPDDFISLNESGKEYLLFIIYAACALNFILVYSLERVNEKFPDSRFNSHFKEGEMK